MSAPVRSPTDKRFRRAHVKPGRRRGWRTVALPLVKYLLVALVAVYGAYRAGAVVLHARVLQIDRIVVRGNERLSSGEVLAVLNGLRGESLVWIDLNEWRQRLLASPWVKDAALHRSLPSTVEVVVSERKPTAVGRIDNKLYLVDDQGLVIDEYGPQFADLDLPIVDGLSANADDGANQARADLAARLIAALRASPDTERRLSQIDVADVHDAAVILDGDPALIHVGEDRFLPRIQGYLDLAPALRERVPDIDYVDLRFDDRIYVRPVGKTKGAVSMATASGKTAAAAAKRAASASFASGPAATRPAKRR